MYKQSYEVEVIINGKPSKEFAHYGRVYIEGREGTRFSIRMRNNSYSRKLFVPTIDGLSIMNGEEGSFDSSGYIVNGNSSITISGWRTSDKDVAEFYFSSPQDSYRKKMKRGNNLGVIGVAVFSEYFRPVYNFPSQTITSSSPNWPQWTTYTTSDAGTSYINYNLQSAGTAGTVAMLSNSGVSGDMKAMSCCSSGSAPSQALGTGWGDKRNSEVMSVDFERCKNPDALFEIHYNTREQLEKMGIDLSRAPIYVAPQAFPGQYCKPPRN